MAGIELGREGDALWLRGASLSDELRRTLQSIPDARLFEVHDAWLRSPGARVATAPKPNEESLTARFLRATEGRHESLVLYWFQPAGRWSRGYPGEMFLRVFDAISGRKRYAFVRISTPLATPAGPGNGSAEERLVELARELAPWVRRVLEGESAGLQPLAGASSDRVAESAGRP